MAMQSEDVDASDAVRTMRIGHKWHHSQPETLQTNAHRERPQHGKILLVDQE